MKRKILLLVLMFLPIMANAYDAKIDGIYYNFSDDEAEVTFQERHMWTKDDVVLYTPSSDYSGALVIPASVDYDGKTYSVTAIGDSAFYMCYEITSVTLPKGLTRIGEYAFHDCLQLTGISFPEGLLSIGKYAFGRCQMLKDIVIPRSVTSIGDFIFYWCENINSIKVEEGNTVYDSRNDCNAIIETAANRLIKGCNNTVIPEDITSICAYAFEQCQRFTSVTIPKGVTTIEEGTFYFCTNLKSVIIPEGVTSIQRAGFLSCHYMESVSIPSSMTYIGEGAFAGCDYLKDVYCYAEQVPETEDHVFLYDPVYKATLHVPAGSVEKYKTTSPWKDFGNIVPITYYPEGTKWTEIRLDTLKYESWYSKVGDEWVPNFETVDYYVKGEYDGGYRDYKLVYTNGPEWTDSLTLLISESQYGLEVTVAVFHENEVFFPPGWAYGFGDWKEGNTLSYQTINGVNTPSIPPAGIREFGIITEIKEAYFGGVCPLKYVDLNGTRIINGIGVTEWNDGECIFGPVDPYFCYYAMSLDLPKERHYRSMLVHFERNGEVLYDVWPAKETVSFTKDQMATIILPTEPDASKGRYYRLDRCEKGKIIFEEELSPKARTPYIIVPKEDFSIDLSTLDLDGLLRDTVSVKGASFIGSYSHEELSCQDGFYIDIIDSTPDCLIIDADQRKAAVGALRAYLVAPWDDPYTQGPTKGVTEKREIVLLDNGTSLTPNPSPVREGSIYDLSGRKINSQFSIFNSQFRKKGLYIQNGKKVAIK